MTGTATPLNEATHLQGVRDLKLTPAFRMGISEIDVSADSVAMRGVRPHALAPVRALLDEAMHRFDRAERATSDAWLGPRLHAALRMSRREAGNRNGWRFLGLWASDYVRWRFGPKEDDHDPEHATAVDRFVGTDTKHALARLWWMAEVFRNGSDYQPASMALTNQDITNNLFRMDVSNHRPTAQAALLVLRINETDLKIGHGRRANALAKATNAAASTLLLDLMAPDVAPDLVARRQWEDSAPDYDPMAYLEQLPDGPDDGPVPTQAVNTMVDLLEGLLADSRVRGQKPDTAP